MSSNLEAFRPNAAGPALPSDIWATQFEGVNAQHLQIPLGTAAWLSPEACIQKFGYGSAPPDSGRAFIGEALEQAATPLGYVDDRHICVVSGSRGGKGAGILVPNLAFWPGSCIVVDPKGENATVSAQRRNGGSAYSWGMGQKVCVLDPFGEAELPASLKARYNPLDAIDPSSDFAVDDAARVAASLVVVDNKNDPYWEEAARNLIKGLILHIVSSEYLASRRNLITLRRLLTQGDWLAAEAGREPGSNDEGPSPFNVLWGMMKRNGAFNGVVAGVGEQMATMADKQRSGVLEAARTNTDFLDSTPMQRTLETSDFDLGELKTNPRGLTVYLTLPARYMPTHYRWLRLMITLAIGEMERIKGRPATGHPTLFLLDEFAGLKRMEVVEHAAAQAAGFGVKFLFVVQNLPQLAELYEKSWETFLGNSGLKLFFQIDDDFTRQYVTRQLGELETVRQTRSGSESQSSNFSTTTGDSINHNHGTGTTRSPFLGIPKSRNRSTSDGTSHSSSVSQGNSASATTGWGENIQKRALLSPDEVGRMLARIDDRSRPGYPGLMLAMIPGEFPMLARRVNYFESPRFRGLFDPHPNHPPPPTLAELQTQQRPTAQVIPLAQPAPAPARVKWKTWGTVLGCVVSVFLIAKAILGPVHSPVTNGGDSQPSTSKQTPSDQPSYQSTLRTPPAPAPAPEPSKPATPTTSAAYRQGLADGREFGDWYSAQWADPYRTEGIVWFKDHVLITGHETCDVAGRRLHGVSGPPTAAFVSGCQEAKIRFEIYTARARAGDPDYSNGFNPRNK